MESNFTACYDKHGGETEEEEQPQFLPPNSSNNNNKKRLVVPAPGFVYLRRLGDGGDLICLKSDRLYTIGRRRRRCQILLNGRRISRYHCQIFLDGSDCKLRLVDGLLLLGGSDPQEIRRRFCDSVEEGFLGKSRLSSNGVFVNSRRLPSGAVAELSVGDNILLGCWRNVSGRGCGEKNGFVVERIVFSANKNLLLSRSTFEDLAPRAAFLLNQLRSIMRSSDPILYLRSSLDLHYGERDVPTIVSKIVQDTKLATFDLDSEKCCMMEIEGINDACKDIVPDEVGNDSVAPSFQGVCYSQKLVETVEKNNCQAQLKKDAAFNCYSDGSTFFLNRLESMDQSTLHHYSGVTLPELLHPIKSLLRVFITTFTCDVSWFLSYCQVPNHLPVTIACHSSERCWSASHTSRISVPYVNYPNLLLVFPPFPDAIAFGKDRKNRGVACHHPKLIILQREDSIRVIITSANLVSKQWNYVTNTVWWQDFPRRNSPVYSTLFGTLRDSKSDFAAQLAGFLASLITDVPSQAHWIKELAMHDFGGAVCHLVASVPGIHMQKFSFPGANYCLSAKQIVQAKCNAGDYLGSVQTSVVGLSHRFRAGIDTNGAQLKSLASLMGKCRENINGTIEVLLKRNMNIPADANAVSVLVADLNNSSEGDSVQLGFLPKDIAKWVSCLSDTGFFSFSAFIYPKEALASAFDSSNMKVQLLLYVLQGPKFSEISKLIQDEHYVPLSSLLASIDRCLGLWRLEEVLSQYNWPESLETDFSYGASSIGTSVNLQFLSAFSAAAGKRPSQFPESDESDPEWGCWTVANELKDLSLRILFPTIRRVKDAPCGIELSKRLLSLSEKTWQKLRSAGVFHDAMPQPCDRVGYPMHVKVARRRFRSGVDNSSFGWIYCGSHNFSPAAWGKIIVPSESKVQGASMAPSVKRLHVCNYELGIILMVPPPSCATRYGGKILNLDDIILPFVIPPPRYQNSDRPATAQAMREVLANVGFHRDITSAAVDAEEMDEDVPDDDDEEEEEEMLEDSSFIEEKEEEKIYAEMLWSQMDSSES